MVEFLVHVFIKDYNKTEMPQVRQAYGILSGAMGIFFNFCLFLGKIITGMISGSIAVTTDAFNNLSDAASSIVTIIGFKLSGHKPDPEHPFGHGRIEYLTGLIVAMLIVVVGFTLFRESLNKVIRPVSTNPSLITFIILFVSILVKLYMYLYNSKLSKKIGSVAMRSTATDSLSDVCATFVVLVCLIIEYCTNLTIDGYAGMAVAVFICYMGINAAIETMNPLLGQPPSAEFVKQILKIVNSYDGVLGVHDLVVHDYGPGRRMLSLHAEVPADADILKAHDMIDNIEMRLNNEFNLESVIHMDPISINDTETKELHKKVAEIISDLDEKLSFHDFRIVKGDSHINVLFDITVPYQSNDSDGEIIKKLKDRIYDISPKYHCIIHVDRSFVENLPEKDDKNM